MKLIFLVFAFALAASLPTQPLQNDFKAGADEPRHINISVISQERADGLFRKFKNTPEIPFRFPPDGCYARAHIMARIAENEGITMGKVFAEGSLQVRTNLPRFPLVKWGWHVAPVVYVRGPGDATKLMVFDPSLFDRPVTPEEWELKMMDTTNGARPFAVLSFSNRYQYWPGPRQTINGWQREHQDNADLRFMQYLALEDRDESPLPDSSPGPNIR